ncbi:MAG: hypothetical protein ACK4ND_18820, partial [Cytophagaceae bacterium]
LIVKKIDIKVPAGYKVKHLPANMNVSAEDYSFKVIFTQKGNVISYYKEIALPTSIIKAQDFENWNNAIRELRKIYEDQIILIK